MNTIGIIDMGSNTIHLTIIKIKNNNNYDVLYCDKEHMRLGSNLGGSGIISDDKIFETLKLLNKYICFCKKYSVIKIVAVATEALRMCKNQYSIVSFIKDKLNLNIRILSKQEESYLSFLGVMSVCNIDKGIIVDLGGNSTELISVKKNSFNDFVSLPYGSINVTENILVNSDGSFKGCLYKDTHFTGVLSNVSFIESMKGSPVIGVGGTFKNLKQIHEHNLGLEENTTVAVESNEIKTLCKSLTHMGSCERKTIRGLNTKRHDTILGGCYLIREINNFCLPSSFILTSSGLRQGLIENYLKNELAI